MATAPPSRWSELRSTLALALASGTSRDGAGWFNLHAVLNLLNRLNGANDAHVREELVTRLADYLTALYRVQSRPQATLSGLCELMRSYAGMRYYMADAVEPWIEYPGPDLCLRSLQMASVADFLQQALDSLLDDYVRRVEVSARRRPRGRLEIALSIECAVGSPTQTLPGWATNRDGTHHTRSACFSGRLHEAPPV